MTAETPDPEARNRHVAPDPAWILPLTPPAGVGVVTPSCTDRTDVLAVPIRTGQGLRIGGEASLCWRCGPGGSVYHPDAGYSMADVRRMADRLPFVTGYDPADLTPAVLAAFERDLRAALARPAAGRGVRPAPDGLLVQVVDVEPQRGTVTVLHAFTIPGDPVRVACEPRMTGDIADRLAADGHPCYAMVERWQIVGPPEPGELWLCRICGAVHLATNPPSCRLLDRERRNGAPS